MSPGMKDQIAKTRKPQSAAQTAQTVRAGKTVPFKRPSGRASFPRRMTLDLDDARFDWLREQAYDARVPAATLLRAAIDLAQSDTALRKRVVSRAQAEHPGP